MKREPISHLLPRRVKYEHIRGHGDVYVEWERLVCVPNEGNRAYT